MKRRKIKLFASVASFALVAAVMSFGVFAATTQSLAITSNVGFTANADVEAFVYGQATANGTAVVDSQKGLYFTGAIPHALKDADEALLAAQGSVADLEEFGEVQQTNTWEWNSAALTENASGDTTFSYTIYFANNAETEATNKVLKISLPAAPVVTDANATLEIEYSNIQINTESSLTSAHTAGDYYVAQGQVGSITVTFKVTDTAKNVDASTIGLGSVTLAMTAAIPNAPAQQG